MGVPHPLDRPFLWMQFIAVLQLHPLQVVAYAGETRPVSVLGKREVNVGLYLFISLFQVELRYNLISVYKTNNMLLVMVGKPDNRHR